MSCIVQFGHRLEYSEFGDKFHFSLEVYIISSSIFLLQKLNFKQLHIYGKY